MRNPVHAGHFFGVELDLFIKCPAQGMEHGAFNGSTQGLGVDHQAAVVRADEPLRPDAAGLAVHFDFGDFRDDRLVAERIREAAARESSKLNQA